MIGSHVATSLVLAQYSIRQLTGCFMPDRKSSYSPSGTSFGNTRAMFLVMVCGSRISASSCVCKPAHGRRKRFSFYLCLKEWGGGGGGELHIRLFCIKSSTDLARISVPLSEPCFSPQGYWRPVLPSCCRQGALVSRGYWRSCRCQVFCNNTNRNICMNISLRD